MKTSWRVFFITRQRSGRIGRSPRRVVPNWSVTASPAQYQYRTTSGSSRCFASTTFCLDCSERFGMRFSWASGSPDTVTSVKTRKLDATSTTTL